MGKEGEYVDFLMVVFATVFFLFGAAIGGLLGHQICRDEWRNELIKRGHGSYVADDKGAVTFKWASPEENK